MKFANNAPLLRLHELGLRAGGAGRVLLDSLSLTIEPGQRWVVLGPNGAGKTTLLNVMAGLMQSASGQVWLGERPLMEFSPAHLAQQRAWCPQFWLDPFPVSARETVACALMATHPQATAAELESMAREWVARLDMSAFADVDVRSLSGGERQRIAIATACAQAAPILLLDEPTAHLDWSHQALLQRLLHEWSAAKGSVVAAVHDLNFAWHLASHALLLDGRGAALAGPRELVMTADNLSRAYGVPVSLREEKDDGTSTRWFRVDLSGGRA